ncbi:class F sortase [Micromonospora sp. WMMD882]|uniref:class F sortase n=1 Tax=Micromonospora sp. WMMD882 TaxID=3015151 RepID=UPI00248B7694|nr:class F sortase [Micromonospora sp. WMMD882]WBB79595.1 class F sortase [Micromonospora sp. WMMD882]
MRQRLALLGRRAGRGLGLIRKVAGEASRAGVQLLDPAVRHAQVDPTRTPTPPPGTPQPTAGATGAPPSGATQSGTGAPPPGATWPGAGVRGRDERPGPSRRWPARRLTRSGPGAPVLVVATLMALIMAMLGVEHVTGTSLLPERFTAGLRPPPRKFPVMPASTPVELDIQAIDLRAPVHHVGLAPDGTIGVPDERRAHEAAWYDQGPTPGQYGPAVIVGHVDTSTGPAVFHDLRRLRAGDRIEVDRADRSVAVFEVNAVERFAKERLPVDEVYGDFSRPNLRLITCGGRWVGGPTGYADNVVVFASLVQAREP